MMTSVTQLAFPGPSGDSITNRGVFTALHAMQTRSSDENSVRLVVCLSICPSHACIVTKR